MIHLIYGEDDVSVEEALAKLKPDTRTEPLGDANISVLESSDLTPENLTSIAFTIPFMADRRLVIIQRLLSKFERQRHSRQLNKITGARAWIALIDKLTELPMTTDVVFVDGMLTPQNQLLTKLKPMARVEVFDLPNGKELGGWISRQADKRSIKIHPEAITAIADVIGRHPRLLVTELEKLALYRDYLPIRVIDVKLMVAYMREASIFQAVDAVIEGRTGDALRLSRQILSDGQPVSYVLTMIARQTRLIILSKDMRNHGKTSNEIRQQLRIPSFAVERTLRQERKLSHQRLNDIYEALIDTDLSIKTSSVNTDLELEILITNLATN